MVYTTPAGGWSAAISQKSYSSLSVGFLIILTAVHAYACKEFEFEFEKAGGTFLVFTAGTGTVICSTDDHCSSFSSECCNLNDGLSYPRVSVGP